MSVSSGDVLDTFASHSFTFQAPVDFTTVAAKKKAYASKKRKASLANLSTAANSENDNANANANQNTAHFLQLALDNLMLALEKETDQFAQIKIQFLVAKTQHILLNTADFETESQIDLQHQMQAIKSEIESKFKEIQNMIANLQFINPPATNSYIIAEPASQSASQTIDQTTNQTTDQIINEHLTMNNGQNSTNSAEKLTYAQAAARAKAPEKCGNSLDKEKEKRNISARSSSNSKQNNLNSVQKSKSSSQSSFSYRERRLILSNSKNSTYSSVEAMKLRDQINKDFQLQLKSSKPVIAAITRSYKQQNIVLTTMSNYNAEYLIQHEKVWSKYFKYQAILKDNAWVKIIAHGIPTEIFNYEKGLELLKEEIKIFNEISPLAVN